MYLIRITCYFVGCFRLDASANLPAVSWIPSGPDDFEKMQRNVEKLWDFCEYVAWLYLFVYVVVSFICFYLLLICLFVYNIHLLIILL